MKFLLFSDLHHYPDVFMSGSWEDLEVLQCRALEENCDFMIHAGDFCHGAGMVSDYVKKYNEFVIPSYHALGNHDTDKTSLKETLEYYKMPADHYFFDCKGYRMIVCNPNYYYYKGEYIPYDLGNYYAHGQYRDFMPPKQLVWLKEAIAQSPYPCILISHESFEREADGVQNQEEVRRIINEANKMKPHSVLMCINGHYHRDNIRILDNVCYFDMNAVRYDWVPNEHNCYPEELNGKYRLLKNTVVYNDPMYAVVTLDGTSITIEGTESTMFMGVTREMTGNRKYDDMGRPVTPRVQSAKIVIG